MGLHEVAVKLGLAYTNNKEAEFKLAESIHNKFNLAVELFKSEKFNGSSSIKFRDCLKKVWVENDGRKKFYVNDDFLSRSFPELCGEDRPIEISLSENWGRSFAEAYHYKGKYIGMFICVGSVDKAKNEEELKKSLLKVISTIYHECDHIYSKSESAEVADFETAILYYLDKAEMRAHAKEMAFVYSTNFPNKKFNYNKFKKYIFASYSASDKMYNNFRYLELMRDPKNFESVSAEINEYIKNKVLLPGHILSVRKLKTGFNSFINYITFFVNYFNEHPEHKFKH